MAFLRAEFQSDLRIEYITFGSMATAVSDTGAAATSILLCDNTKANANIVLCALNSQSVTFKHVVGSVSDLHQCRMASSLVFTQGFELYTYPSPSKWRHPSPIMGSLYWQTILEIRLIPRCPSLQVEKLGLRIERPAAVPLRLCPALFIVWVTGLFEQINQCFSTAGPRTSNGPWQICIDPGKLLLS